MARLSQFMQTYLKPFFVLFLANKLFFGLVFFCTFFLLGEYKNSELTSITPFRDDPYSTFACRFQSNSQCRDFILRINSQANSLEVQLAGYRFFMIIGLVLIFWYLAEKLQKLYTMQEKSKYKRCEFCAEQIRAAAVICRFCQKEVSNE